MESSLVKRPAPKDNAKVPKSSACIEAKYPAIVALIVTIDFEGVFKGFKKASMSPPWAETKRTNC